MRNELKHKNKVRLGYTQIHHFKGLEHLPILISWVAGTNLQQRAQDALFHCINMHSTLIHCIIYGHFAIHSLGRGAAANSAAIKILVLLFWWTFIYISVGCISQRRIAGPEQIFSMFLSIFPKQEPSLYSHQQQLKVVVTREAHTLTSSSHF